MFPTAHGVVSQVVAGAPPDFLPTDLPGLALWLDASDPATITDAGGGAVAQWTSKDPNGRVFSQTTGSLRPTTGVTTLNGKNTLLFDEDSLTFAGTPGVWNFLHDGTEYSLFMVARMGPDSDPNRMEKLLGTSGNTNNNRGVTVAFDDRNSLGRNNALFHQVANGAGGGMDAVQHTTLNNFAAPNQHVLFTLVADPDAVMPSARSAFILNGGGTPSQQNSSGDAPTALNATDPLHIGYHGTGTQRLRGEIAELVIVEGVLAATARRALEAHLASKWGLTLDAPVVSPSRLTTIVSDSLHNGFPGLTVNASGRHITVYRAAAHHDPAATGGANGQLVSRYSDNGGLTWSGASTVVSDTSNYDARDAALTLLGDDRIALAYFLYGAGPRVLFSDDGGGTWGSPISIGVTSPISSNGSCSAPVVEMPNGDLILPVYGSNACVLVRSEDGGQTWGSQVTIIDADAGKGWSEPFIVRLQNGHLLCALRANAEDTIYFSASTDGGATWSTPTTGFSGDSRVALLQLPNGDVVCLYRHSWTGPVSVRVSQDNGVTWGERTEVMPDRGAYGQMAIDPATGLLHFVQSSEVSTANAGLYAGTLS